MTSDMVESTWVKYMGHFLSHLDLDVGKDHKEKIVCGLQQSLFEQWLTAKIHNIIYIYYVVIQF